MSKKIKVRIKRSKPVVEAINPELGAEEKWSQFITSVDETEWKWLKRRLGLLTQTEWLAILDATNRAEKGDLRKSSQSK